MYHVYIKHPDVSEQKLIATTLSKDSPYVRHIIQKYEYQGYAVLFVKISNQDVLA